MAVSTEFRDLLAELLAPLGPVAVRGMFGGAGIFLDGLMFALVVDETLYLKVDDGNRGRFEAAGSQPFSYMTKGGRRAVMAYWEAPTDLLDEPERLCDWARDSVRAALAAAAAKPASRARPRRR